MHAVNKCESETQLVSHQVEVQLIEKAENPATLGELVKETSLSSDLTDSKE